MSVSRRSFLKSTAVVSAAIAFNPATLVFGKNTISSNGKVPDQFYSREMFEPYVGQTFRVRVGKQSVDLKLVALTDVAPASGITTGKSRRTDCFSMRFHAVKPLPPTVHTLNHSKLGNFDLFMVQSKDGSRFSQTAIINHVV